MKRSFTAVLVFAAVLLLILEILQPMYTGDPVKNGMIQTILTRTVGAVLFFLLIRKSGCPVLGLPDAPRSLLYALPALAVAVNNAPIIGLATGNAALHGTGADLLLLALQSLAVGLFEELTFRGYLFPMILEKYRDRSVFLPAVLSSAVFAAVHLVNLFSGSSPAAAVLQVGYSFLIGGMCTVVLLKTRCIWIPVLIHGIYNFGGTLVPTLGSGRIWDPATVTITAVLGVIVLVIMLRILSRVTKEEAERLYC